MQSVSQAEMTKAVLDEAQPEKPSRLARLEAFVAGMDRSKEDGTTVVERRRLYRRLLRSLRDVDRPRHLTKTGFAIQPTDKPFEWEYRLTPREVNRRRNRRKMQRASRRANRT